MTNKNDDPKIEYLPPRPGGKQWQEFHRQMNENVASARNSRTPDVPERELDRARRMLKQARANVRRHQEKRRQSDPKSPAEQNDLARSMDAALSPLGVNLEHHFQRLVKLGAEALENKLREFLGGGRK